MEVKIPQGAPTYRWCMLVHAGAITCIETAHKFDLIPTSEMRQ
jgi:hypothetical protein